jgi:hypothetical protein
VRKIALLAVLLASASGCAREPSRLVGPACPSLPEYSKDIQSAAANELDGLPDGTVLKELFIPDYQRMRDGTRACRDGINGAAP